MTILREPWRVSTKNGLDSVLVSQFIETLFDGKKWFSQPGGELSLLPMAAEDRRGDPQRLAACGQWQLPVARGGVYGGDEAACPEFLP